MNKNSNNMFLCLICKEDRAYYAYGSCEHDNICLFCCIRMRILYKDKRCPVCTIKLEYVYMCDVSDHKLVFKQLDKEKDTMVKDDEFKENGIYYTSYLIKEESLKLRNFICPISNCSDGSFETLQNLTNHITRVHKRFYW